MDSHAYRTHHAVCWVSRVPSPLSVMGSSRGAAAPSFRALKMSQAPRVDELRLGADGEAPREEPCPTP